MNTIDAVIARFQDMRNAFGAAPSASKDEYTLKLVTIFFEEREQKRGL